MKYLPGSDQPWNLIHRVLFHLILSYLTTSRSLSSTNYPSDNPHTHRPSSLTCTVPHHSHAPSLITHTYSLSLSTHKLSDKPSLTTYTHTDTYNYNYTHVFHFTQWGPVMCISSCPKSYAWDAPEEL